MAKPIKAEPVNRPVYSRDAILRVALFEVVQRKSGKEPLWRRKGGIPQLQSAALRVVAWEITDGAEAEESD